MASASRHFLRRFLRLGLPCSAPALCPARGGMALVPKDDASMRPIAVATVGMCLCAVMTLGHVRGLGIPAKGIGDFHELMFDQLQSAGANSANWGGFKADIPRCFDSLRWNTMFFRHLGAPGPLVDLLASCYSSQIRWFSVWCRTSCAGAGFSWLASRLSCFSCLVECLHGHLPCLCETHGSGVRLTLYLDDRTGFHSGPRTAEQLCVAAQAACAVDEVLGIEAHPDKAACFAFNPSLRTALSAHR